MYMSQRDASITENPRKTTAPNVEIFIHNVCKYSYGCNTITEEIYKKYIEFCNDHNLVVCNNFNTFARAFRYAVIHDNRIPGVGVFPVNYQAYKEGIGYITKKGWSYSNLAINY